jgi:signal transduction histidine kinase
MDIVGRQCFDVLGCGVSDRCPILMGLRGEASDPMHLSMSAEWTHPILGRRYRPRYFSTVPTADEEGTLGNGMLIMVEDVTAVQQFESDSSREQKLNAVGLLAATLSHEINQPLGAIMGRAQLAIISLEREHLDVPALKRDLEEIVESVNRVSKILDKLHQVTDIVTKPYLGETEILDLERSSRTERGED